MKPILPAPKGFVVRASNGQKKAGVTEDPKVFDHAGLLVPLHTKP